MNADSQKILSLGLTLAPSERVALARELLRSAAAENAAFAGEVGEAVSTYDAFGSPAVSGLVALPGGGPRATFTLEYWQDEDWYVGRLKEVPGVFSQGETLAELEDNIRDAYSLIAGDSGSPASGGETSTKRIEVNV